MQMVCVSVWLGGVAVVGKPDRPEGTINTINIEIVLFAPKNKLLLLLTGIKIQAPIILDGLPG